MGVKESTLEQLYLHLIGLIVCLILTYRRDLILFEIHLLLVFFNSGRQRLSHKNLLCFKVLLGIEFYGWLIFCCNHQEHLLISFLSKALFSPFHKHRPNAFPSMILFDKHIIDVSVFGSSHHVAPFSYLNITKKRMISIFSNKYFVVFPLHHFVKKLNDVLSPFFFV